MPTVRWDTRSSSPHYYFRLLERFHMVQMLSYLELILMLFMLEMSDNSSSCITLPLLTMMTIFPVEDNLRRIRPSNFYLPAFFHEVQVQASSFPSTDQGYTVGRQDFHLWPRQEQGSN